MIRREKRTASSDPEEQTALTVAQAQVLDTLVRVLFGCWALYFVHSRTFGRARPADAGEAFAWRFLEVFFAICVLIFVVLFVTSVLDATVWPSPEGQRPEPGFTPNALDFISGAAIVAFIVVPGIRRIWRWMRRLPSQRSG
jgi:hypothetical protein